jgi:glutamine synthetase type III
MFLDYNHWSFTIITKNETLLPGDNTTPTNNKTLLFFICTIIQDVVHIRISVVVDNLSSCPPVAVFCI